MHRGDESGGARDPRLPSHEPTILGMQKLKIMASKGYEYAI